MERYESAASLLCRAVQLEGTRPRVWHHDIFYAEFVACPDASVVMVGTDRLVPQAGEPVAVPVSEDAARSRRTAR
ncbi:hypothetical protein [Nocardioides houyundeii]|uniref:hypothetical protein n=1 Tax=Nocardioides houyundeii TaxID=2045452 RepID=UPI0013155E7B|nr:hypothetical protein [Nocardioides houyundeii]